MAREAAGVRWDDDLQAQLADRASGYGEQLARLRQARAQAGEVTAVARSRDGLVTVLVGAHGQLLGLELRPAVFTSLPPRQLEAAITGLAAAAARDAAEQVRHIMTAALPEGWAPAGAVPAGLSLLGGGVAGLQW